MAEQRQFDASDNTLTIVFAFGIFLLVLGYFFGDVMTKWYLAIKMWEAKIIGFLLPFDWLQAMVARFLRLTGTLDGWVNHIYVTPVHEWSLQKTSLAGKEIGRYIFLVFGGLFGYIGWKAYKAHPIHGLRRVHSMQSLIDSEQKLWPYITPIIGLDLVKEDINKGPWAMSMRPYDFCVKYKLLNNDKDLNSLNKEKVKKLFSSQLGRLWEGPDKLPKATKSLFAVFAAHGCYDKDNALGILNKIAASTANGNEPDFSVTDKIFEQFKNDPRVKEVYSKHAYVNTVMAAMLEFARKNGVLPSSYFIWLRPRNRILFYTLNCIGRQVTFVEVAGIFGHWNAEKIAEHQMEKPFVEKAVEGLEKALAEIKLD